jgi:uncharacterized membrane protein YjjB (DUF3815 family)
MLVLLAAWIGQLLGNLLFGAEVSGFFGALAMTPIALAIARLPSGPPSQVTFLPAFWLLVPGALGLIGVTELVGDPATANVGALVKPIGSIVSIALGVLGGVSIYRGIAAGTPLGAGRDRGAPPSTPATCRGTVLNYQLEPNPGHCWRGLYTCPARNVHGALNLLIPSQTYATLIGSIGGACQWRSHRP